MARIISVRCDCPDGCTTAYLYDAGGTKTMLGCEHARDRWPALVREAEARRSERKP